MNNDALNVLTLLIIDMLSYFAWNTVFTPLTIWQWLSYQMLFVFSITIGVFISYAFRVIYEILTNKQ